MTWIKSPNGVILESLSGWGGKCEQELGLMFSQCDPNVIKRLSDRVAISVTARDDSGC